jgi:hypothetical protein
MSNTNEKIKHLPINLLLSLGYFGISFSALSMLQDNNYISVLVALVIYLNNAMTESKIDYLEEEIKSLKNK